MQIEATVVANGHPSQHAYRIDVSEPNLEANAVEAVFMHIADKMTVELAVDLMMSRYKCKIVKGASFDTCQVLLLKGHSLKEEVAHTFHVSLRVA